MSEQKTARPKRPLIRCQLPRPAAFFCGTCKGDDWDACVHWNLTAAVRQLN